VFRHFVFSKMESNIIYPSFGLTPFSNAIAQQFLARSDAKTTMPHVLAWADELSTGGRARSTISPPSIWQRGCPEIIPGLSARPFWLSNSITSESGFLPSTVAEFVSILEAAVGDIREEVLALRGKRAFQEYRAPEYEIKSQSIAKGEGQSIDTLGKTGTDRGDWSIIYLDLHNAVDAAGVTASRALFPKTCAVLSKAPRPYGHSLISALSPGTHIPSHTGASNKKIRIHLPLIVPRSASHNTDTDPPLCRLRVGPQCESWTEGKCLIFDDSHQHEAWHDLSPDGRERSLARVVLIVDIWHPDLTDTEVKFLSFIRSSQMRSAKAFSDARMIPKEADFFAIINQAREEGSDDKKVFGDINVIDD
jgi:aspartate beta-hydroxylase